MGTLGVAALAAGTSALQNRYGMGLAQASSVNTETTQTSANNVTLSTAKATTVTESPSTETTATAAPIATVTTAPTATIEAASASGSASTTCAVRCQRGCSYPGRCRKYTDANGNGRCDFGECL